MKGTLSGCVLEALRSETGAVRLKLTGISGDDRRPDAHTWILVVDYPASLAPKVLPVVGSVGTAACMATHEVFMARGQKASRVRVIGTKFTPGMGTLVKRGSVQFLSGATNSFAFRAHLVRSPVTKPVGVTEARVGVTDRKGHVHYFSLEAWRVPGDILRELKSGSEVDLWCALRRDRVDGPGGVRVFESMVAQAAVPVFTRPQAAPASAAPRFRELAQAAD